MAIENTRFTPKRRGPTLSDGSGGSSERPAARQADPVLRDVGHMTQDIRLTATGTDADASQGAFYSFGKVGRKSVGRYRLTVQGAASATAEPLGAISYAEFEIREQTAGVYNVAWVTHFDGIAAAEDASQDQTNIATANRADDGDSLDFSSSASADTKTSVFICTSTQATDIAALTSTGKGSVSAGDLVLHDARAASTRVYSVVRLS